MAKKFNLRTKKNNNPIPNPVVKLNPFEIIQNTHHNPIKNKNFKKSINKRKSELISEFNSLTGKSNGSFKDSRIQTSKIRKLISNRKLKNQKFNLNENDNLDNPDQFTHLGAPISFDEDPNQSGGEDDFLTEKVEIGDNSRLSELILQSKLFRQLKTEQLTNNAELTTALDEKLDTIKDLLPYRKQNIDDENDKYYESLQSKLKNDARIPATDKTLTEEEKMSRMKNKLEDYERERVKRMNDSDSEINEDENFFSEDEQEASTLIENSDNENLNLLLSEDESVEKKDNKKNLISKKKKISVKFQKKDQDEIPFTFDLPTTVSELSDLLDSKTFTQQNTIINRIIVCNYEETVNFLPVLVDFMLLKIDNISNSKKANSDMIDETMLQYSQICLSIYQLAKSNIRQTTSFFANKVLDISKPLLTINKLPSASVILFFKLAFSIFPLSDYHHRVINPISYFLASILSKTIKIDSHNSLLKYFFIMSLLSDFYLSTIKAPNSLELTTDTSRYRFIPELFHFSYRITHDLLVGHLSSEPCYLITKEYMNNLKKNSKSKDSDNTDFFSLKWLFMSSSDKVFSSSLFLHTLNFLLYMLSLLHTASKSFPSYPEFVQKFFDLEKIIKSQHLPSFLKPAEEKINQFFHSLHDNYSFSIKSRQPLHIAEKPHVIGSLEPLIDDEHKIKEMNLHRKNISKKKSERRTILRQYRKEGLLLDEAKSKLRDQREERNLWERKRVRRELEEENRRQ